MRRGERFAQVCSDLLYQLLPYLPVFLVVSFDLRNAFGLVFLELGKLEKRDIEQIAAFRGQHGWLPFQTMWLCYGDTGVA